MPGLEKKAEIAVPFIEDRIREHRKKQNRPFFLGLNGVQGAGKTTLVSYLKDTLTNPPHSLQLTTFSLDDFYLPHDAQLSVARNNPSNPLIQHRGQPGTHDVKLLASVFAALRDRKSNIHIPSYDKAAFNGEGDQKPENEWSIVNSDESKTVDVVLFEGWCVGFRPLDEAELKQKWHEAVEHATRAKESGSDEWTGRLGLQEFENVQYVNERLKEMDEITNYFDAFLHIDAGDTKYVYGWRHEAEEKMREEKGSGMTDDQVVNFVNGYYPAYELFTDTLRRGIFSSEHKGKQLRIVVDRERTVVHWEVI